MDPPRHRIKRCVDVCGALVGLAITWPLFPLAAIAIRLDSQGPVFTRELRVGRQRRRAPDVAAREGSRLHDARGSLFGLLRFRVMGDEVRSPGRSAGEHPRLTRVGRVLRGTGIESVPQLWNVLVGHMSLVGPRPGAPDLVERLAVECPLYRDAAIGVRPGLFGLAQLQGPEANSFFAHVCEKVLFDLHYMTRLRQSSWNEALRMDLGLAAACVGRRLRRRQVIGNEVIRITYPRVLEQVAVDVGVVCRRTPPDVGAEVHGDGHGLTAWWYPPRRRALRLPAGDERWLAGFCDEASGTESGGLVVRNALRPGPSRQTDVVSIELPRALHDVHDVCEHLNPLWEALADRVADERLPFRMSFLLLEGLSIVSHRVSGRLGVEVWIGPRELTLRIDEADPQGDGALARLSDMVAPAPRIAERR